MSPNQPRYDVFLCHNSEDKDLVRQVEEKLRAKGVKAWFDERELPPGTQWRPALEEQIDLIGAAAVFVGNSGIGPWQQLEIDAFLRQLVQRNLPVIPVFLQDAKDAALPPFMGRDYLRGFPGLRSRPT